MGHGGGLMLVKGSAGNRKRSLQAISKVACWPDGSESLPPDLSIIHGGGADYPEIGSVLFEAAVEAGITGFVTIHRAQH